MAKKKSDTTENEDEGGKSGKLKLAIGAVVLVAAGAAIGSQLLGGGDAANASAMEPTTTTTEPPGPITSLDTITLNLADGRFLKVGLAFEVHHDEDYPDPDMVDDMTKGFAREIDVAISTLSAYTFEQLAAPNGKSDAKQALLDEVVRVSDGAVRNVLFHEFVMQ